MKTPFNREATREATFVIAAADSTTESKAQADSVCHGVDDDVVIQDAIDNLPAGGGKIYLLAGNYSISDTILIDGGTYISGDGRTATIITLANNSDCDMFQPRDQANGCHRAMFEHFMVDGNKDNQSAGNGFYGRFYNCYFNDLEVESVYTWGFYAYATDVTPGWGAQENVWNNSYFWRSGAGSLRFSPYGSDNWINKVSSWNSYGTEDVLIEGGMNKLTNCGFFGTFLTMPNSDYGIHIVGGAFLNTVLNCTIDTFKKHGIFLDANVTTIAFTDISHNLVRSVSKETNNTYDGIHLGNATMNGVIYGRVIGNMYHAGWLTLPNKPAYAIRLTGANANFNVVQQNMSCPGDYVTGNVGLVAAGANNDVAHNIP